MNKEGRKMGKVQKWQEHCKEGAIQGIQMVPNDTVHRHGTGECAVAVATNVVFESSAHMPLKVLMAGQVGICVRGPGGE